MNNIKPSPQVTVARFVFVLTPCPPHTSHLLLVARNVSSLGTWHLRATFGSEHQSNSKMPLFIHMASQEKKKKLSKSKKKKSTRIKGKRELKLEVLKLVLESIFRFQLNGQHHTITTVRWNIFLPAKVSSIQQRKSRTHWLKEKWIFAWISHQSSGNELDDKDPEFEPDSSPKRLKMVGEETSQEPLDVERQLCGTPIYGHPLYTDSFICPDKKLIYFL